MKHSYDINVHLWYDNTKSRNVYIRKWMLQWSNESDMRLGINSLNMKKIQYDIWVKNHEVEKNTMFLLWNGENAFVLKKCYKVYGGIIYNTHESTTFHHRLHCTTLVWTCL